MTETFNTACGCVITAKLHTGIASNEDIHVVWISKRCDNQHIDEIMPITVTSRTDD